MAKLTLNADREVIGQAKRLAAEQNTSVSAMFGRFIRTLANGRGKGKPLGRLARRASGVIDLKGRNHRDVLADSLATSTDYEYERSSIRRSLTSCQARTFYADMPKHGRS
jgi:hypothetical protein